MTSEELVRRLVGCPHEAGRLGYICVGCYRTPLCRLCASFGWRGEWYCARCEAKAQQAIARDLWDAYWRYGTEVRR